MGKREMISRNYTLAHFWVMQTSGAKGWYKLCNCLHRIKPDESFLNHMAILSGRAAIRTEKRRDVWRLLRLFLFMQGAVRPFAEAFCVRMP
jgi:hypothetical protein